MAAPSNQVPGSARKPTSSDVASSRWSRSTEPGPVSNGSSQPLRGRHGRPRNGGRTQKSSQNPRDDKPTTSNDASASTPSDTFGRSNRPEKPTLSITSSSDFSNTAVKKQNPSTRPSKPSSAVNTSQSSPVAEPPVSPASSRSSNRRKRSGAGKGNNIPKINPPTSRDNLLRPGRPRIDSTPLTAPVKDPPPHLSHNLSSTSTGSFDMSKNIDALVERVRAVAMAENRPSTPGSHIDWAGDDDDSLPDLDDWGIPSLVDHKAAQVISPIMVDGLKPLPEFSSASSENATGKEGQQAPPPSDTPSSKLPSKAGIQGPQAYPKPPDSSSINVINDITGSRHFPPSGGPPAVVTLEANPDDAEKQLNPALPRKLNKDKVAPPPSGVQNQEDLTGQGVAGSGGPEPSVRAPTPEQHTEPEPKGLGASMHAPRVLIDTPAHPSGQSPRNRQTHTRAQTVGRPPPRPNQADNYQNRSPRLGRGGFLGSPKRHARHYSSPSTTTPGRSSHSRPVLTGDAMSRLARVVGSTTTPPAKTTPVGND